MRNFLTLAIGLLGGAIFFASGIPLPWLLGSMAVIAALSILKVGKLAIPAAWREYAMAGIGTALGAGFSPDTLSHIGEWRWSLSAMVVLSIGFSLLAALILKRWSDMGPMTSFLAGVPGSVSLVSALSEEYGADTRRVALSHSARLIALLTMTPVMLRMAGNADLVEASRKAVLVWPVFDWIETPLLVAGAVFGFLVGKKSGLPAGTLMIPLVISGSLHLSGLLSGPVPAFVPIFSQVVIGVGIGLRFNGYRIRDIAQDGWLSALIGIVFSLVSFGAAVAIESVTGLELVPLLLAFLPGGAPELGAVAIALHADPAMVAGHHLVRLILILTIVPPVAGVLMVRLNSKLLRL